MPLEQLVEGAGAVARLVEGISKVHTEAPDSLMELPALLVHPDNGDAKHPRNSGSREMAHRLKLQLFVNRGGSLQEAETLLRPFVGRFFTTFDQHITLNSSCQSSGLTRYQYGILTYAEVDYLGITFDLTAEEVEYVVFQP